jgi:uncharacterized peroxidase-related enzyme
MLENVAKQVGTVPNMHRLMAISPVALEGYLALTSALERGALPAATRERIALAVAEFNGSNYCLSAHNAITKKVAKLDDAEIAANRAGCSMDPKAGAAVKFAAKVVHDQGHVAEADLREVKAAGYDDAQVIEIIQHVALNVFTNYLNSVAQTDIDFPVIVARKAA